MRFLRFFLRLSLIGALGGTWLLAGTYLFLSPNLPDVETLRDVRLQTPMRVYTHDGELIGQFGEQKRNPLKFDEIPTRFIQALLAAEDDGFFEHSGIDAMGLMRAVSELVLTGEKGSGGSTLTMQVARNYFLSLERTFIRKFNEILLALEIERALSKEEIFELYVNRIFLGHRAYGFEAAAQVYYGKSLNELALPQLAMLAGIPKAPSRNNPISGSEAGRERRNWILGRMAGLGYISDTQRQAAIAAPVIARHHGARLSFNAPYVAEMARQEMLERYGPEIYTEGYSVYTTVDSKLQQVAQHAVIDGLITYDKRHGYRGGEQHFQPPQDLEPRDFWLNKLSEIPVIAGLTPAVVVDIQEKTTSPGLNLSTAPDGQSAGTPAETEGFATLLMADGTERQLLWSRGINSARRYLSENSRGGKPQSVGSVLRIGDLVRVQPDADGLPVLSQVPAAQAALVSLRPSDGAILSLVGGMGFELSKFNRATQAKRQPGSSIKPFIYAAALDAGFTAASIINDAPVVLNDSALESTWRPENDGGKFHGPTRLRWALTKSRNLVSIRLLQQLGIRKAINYLDGLGFDTDDFPRDLSLALGSPVLAPLELATAYALLANGGHRVDNYLISHIEDINGERIFQAEPPTACQACEEQKSEAEDELELSMEEILARAEQQANRAPRVMDSRVNFIIDSMLKDVVKRGTGRRALALKRNDLAGKTGTTNGPMDAWFSGYNADVVTTTWVGFDNYTPLGKREFGGTAALPIWISYMREALDNSPQQQRPTPVGIVSVRIDPATGLLAGVDQNGGIFEYFREEYLPTESAARGLGDNPATEELIKDIF